MKCVLRNLFSVSIILRTNQLFGTNIHGNPNYKIILNVIPEAGSVRTSNSPINKFLTHLPDHQLQMWTDQESTVRLLSTPSIKFLIMQPGACVLSHFSHVCLFATLWTVACQAPLSGILQARILEWVPPGESSQPRDQTCISVSLLHWQVDSLALAPPGKPNAASYHLTFVGVLPQCWLDWVVNENPKVKWTAKEAIVYLDNRWFFFFFFCLSLEFFVIKVLTKYKAQT